MNPTRGCACRPASQYDSKDKENKPSFARDTDGTGDWYIMMPTQGATNAGASKVSDEKIEW